MFFFVLNVRRGLLAYNSSTWFYKASDLCHTLPKFLKFFEDMNKHFSTKLSKGYQGSHIINRNIFELVAGKAFLYMTRKVEGHQNLQTYNQIVFNSFMYVFTGTQFWNWGSSFREAWFSIGQPVRFTTVRLPCF